MGSAFASVNGLAPDPCAETPRVFGGFSAEAAALA